MEKEQVAVDEAVETVAEENTRAYSKTVWNESTPITADRLNKMETGIADASRDAANCLPLTGGTLTGFLSVSGYSKSISMGAGPGDVFINNSASGKYLQLKDDGTLSYDDKKIYHEGNKPTAWDIGALPISGGTLTGKIDVPGESTFSQGAYVDPWYGEICAIKASGNVGIGGNLKVNGNLAFSNYGGSNLNANINSLALHAATGNGQIMTVGSQNNLYIGNSNTPLVIESSRTPDVNVGGNVYQLYHTGNKPTAGAIGAMSSNAPSFQGNMIQAGAGGRDWIYHINADRGSLHIAPHNNGNNDWNNQIYFERNGQIYCNGGNRVPTMAGNNPAHYMFRYGSGLGGANGYITFSY